MRTRRQGRAEFLAVKASDDDAETLLETSNVVVDLARADEALAVQAIMGMRTEARLRMELATVRAELEAERRRFAEVMVAIKAKCAAVR